MPIDDRSDLDRLSRSQLYQEADAQGIKYPPDLPKYIWSGGAITGGMVSLLTSAGIHRGNMKTVQWQTVTPSEEERMAAAHQGVATSEQHYPVRPLHQSARDGIDTTAILEAKLEKAAAQKTAQDDELAKAKAENKALMDRLAALEARLAPAQEPEPKVVRTASDRRWALFREAQLKGLAPNRKMTLKELEALLGQDAP